jgi:hypothetical protein
MRTTKHVHHIAKPDGRMRTGTNKAVPRETSCASAYFKTVNSRFHYAASFASQQRLPRRKENLKSLLRVRS